MEGDEDAMLTDEESVYVQICLEVLCVIALFSRDNQRNDTYRNYHLNAICSLEFLFAFSLQHGLIWLVPERDNGCAS